MSLFSQIVQMGPAIYQILEENLILWLIIFSTVVAFAEFAWLKMHLFMTLRERGVTR